VALVFKKRRDRTALVAVALVAATSCFGGETSNAGPALRVASVDGGLPTVAFLESIEVGARPGDTLRIEHSGAPADSGAGTTHAFVSVGKSKLPPLFVEAPGGAIPNAAVWGPCTGGDASEAVGRCPVPAVEAASRWDGEGYWSTGAMLPGEERDVPLSRAIDLGTYSFVCVLHPQLRIDVEITDEAVEEAATEGPSHPPPPSPAGGRNEVLAGYETQAPPTAVNAFVPGTIRIATGEGVTWTAPGRDPRDVVFGVDHVDLSHSTPADARPNASQDAWDGSEPVWSGFMSTDPSAPGGTRFRLTFTRPGRYPYVCRFHPDMSGVVIVKGEK
jgi:plastocyanin